MQIVDKLVLNIFRVSSVDNGLIVYNLELVLIRQL